MVYQNDYNIKRGWNSCWRRLLPAASYFVADSSSLLHALPSREGNFHHLIFFKNRLTVQLLVHTAKCENSKS